jgi:D-sedoheptulose 7-phosphate isomerase
MIMLKFTIDIRMCIQEYREGVKATLDSLAVEDIHLFISYLQETYEEDRQLFIIGNGGSAATASHMACDLAKSVLILTTA